MPAATAHLRHLVAANLVTVARSGRRKLHTLASADVAAAIEALAAISPPKPVESLRQARLGSRLRRARVCYGHLGGSLAVAITDRLVAAAVVDPPAQGRAGLVHHTDDPILAALGLTGSCRGGDAAVRGCLDWTERVPHLAGRFGNVLLTALVAAGWLSRQRTSRALTVTALGERHLTEFGL